MVTFFAEKWDHHEKYWICVECYSFWVGTGLGLQYPSGLEG